MMPSEVVKFLYIRELLQRTVRLRSIPSDFAKETDFLLNQFGHLANADFLARAYVDMTVANLGDTIGILHTRVVGILEIHVQQDMDGSVGHLFTPQKLTHGTSCTPECYSVWFDSIMKQHTEDICLATLSVDTYHMVTLAERYRAQVDVLPHGLPIALIEAFGQVNLAYHGRQHMRVLQVEIIVRTIEVGGHYGDVVGAVLYVEIFTHFQSRNLGDGVGLVGVFQGRCEQAVLGHRLGCLARIDARGTEEKQFFHTVSPALADHVLLYLQVLVDEVGAVVQVGHNASHMGRCQNHRIGLFLIEETPDRHRVHQVQFLVRASHEVGISPTLQVIPNSGTHKAVVSRYVNLTILVECHLIRQFWI